MKFSKIHIFIFAVSFVLTGFIVWLFLPSKKTSENLYFRQSYDMRQLRLDNSDIETLKIGDRLDTATIKNVKGESISSFSDKNLLLLAVVSPTCQACDNSKDLMAEIRKSTANTKISYYPILTADSPTDELENYTKNLGFEKSLYASSTSPFPKMLTPSHILIDKNGTVIQTWFGSSSDKEGRKRIGYQISSDLLTIQDVFQALAKNNN